jgi:quercetin dioxygenase-like cupin family protein
MRTSHIQVGSVAYAPVGVKHQIRKDEDDNMKLLCRMTGLSAWSVKLGFSILLV